MTRPSARLTTWLVLLVAIAQLGAADTGTISGAVVDAGGVALGGATVYLIIEHGGCPSVIATTDVDGRFAFRGAQPGTYRLRAEKPGYVTRLVGEALILTSAHLRQDVVIALPRAAAPISGTVYGEDGKPLPNGGYVFFEDERHDGVATTGLPNGRYSVSNLPVGRYYVSAKRYSPAAGQVVGDEWYYPGTTDRQQAELVTLDDRPAFVDIRFGRAERPSIVLSVWSDRGLPVTRAEVSLQRLRDASGTDGPSDSSTWDNVQSLRTDANGTATIAGLKTGRYCAFVARVPAPFSPWRRATAEAGSLDSYAQSVEVFEGGAPVQIDFVVAPGAALTGRFVMRDGGAPPRAHGIRIDLSSSPFVGGFRGNMTFLAVPGRIDDDGFDIEGLSPLDRYTIREFDGNPFRPVVIVGVRMNGAALRGDDIVAGSLAAPARIDVILDRAGVVSGTIRNTRTKNITVTRVSGAVPAALYPRTMTTAVVGGRFVIRGLPPGDYDVAPEGSTVRRIHVGAGEFVDLTF
jgi:hypothetical protein